MNQAAPSPSYASPLHSDRGSSSDSTSASNNAAPAISPKASSKRSTTLAKDVIAGACAGAIAKTVVAPIERVKLLVQLQFSIDSSGSNKNGKNASLSAGRIKHQHLGAWEVTKRVYKEQGLLAFWRGMKAITTLCLNFNLHFVLFLV